MIKFMKKTLSTLLATVLLANLMIVPIMGENYLIYETVDKTTVTKGLTYEHKSKFTQQGWVDIHVLTMDLNEEQVALNVLRSAETYGLRNTLSNIAKEDSQVVAGINGSFFNMSTTTSDPLGITYEDGFTYANQGYNTLGHGAASLIQNKDGSINFDFFGVSIKFENELGRSLYIDGINKLTMNDLPVIYNALIGLDSSQIDALGNFYKIKIVNDIVTEVVSPKQVTTMPLIDEGYIIALPDSIALTHLPYFDVGTKTSLTIDSTIDLEDIQYAISGGGKVLENGAVVLDGYIVESTKRHPRTAVGITADKTKLIAMVVDGRGESIGATHNELAGYLLEYKVSDAIHLDGGGSSTLVRRDTGSTGISVANTVSGGAQRKILNGIGFVSLAEPGPITTINIVASTVTTFKNNPIYLSVLGYDANSNPIPVDTSKLVWNMEDLEGIWETNTFIPTTSGTGKLTGYYNGIKTTIQIKSLDTPIDLTVSPKILSLGYNQTGSFTIQGLDNSGFAGAINANDITYTIDNPTLGSFVNGVFKSTDISGIAKVTLKIGERWTTAYISVGSTKNALPYFDSFSYVERAYPDESVTGSVTKDETVFFDTGSSYRIDYHIKSSADAQAYYMMIDDFSIENPTEFISLQAYGNESGHMIRGKIIDANNVETTLTFSSDINWKGWKELSVTLPQGTTFPIKLDRLYVVALQSVGEYDGTLYFDSLTAMTSLDTSDLRYDDEGFINDSLRVKVKPKDSYEIKVFGPTAFRNRLLDDILVRKVYEKMNTANFGIFAGTTDINETKLTVNHSVWNNTFSAYKADGVKVINLATKEGGLRSTDYTQYEKLATTLATTSENTIILVASKNPLTTFTDKKEGELLHKILKEFAAKTGKTMIYINAGGYETNVSIRDGIRYFDLSGLWYRVQDRRIALNETFYTLSFYIKSGQVTYNLEPVYPIVEIMEK